MHKLGLILLLLVLAAGSARAMGGNGNEEYDPAFKQNVKAEISDAGGMHVTLEQVKIEGRAGIHGVMGKATVTVPFANINYIELGAKGGKFSATVYLQDGQQVVLVVKKSDQLIGQANFGKYRIALGQVVRIKVLAIAD